MKINSVAQTISIQSIKVIFLIILFLSVFGLYFITRKFQFLGWDDFKIIVSNPDVKLCDFKNIFTNLQLQSYFPLVLISYCAQNALFDTNAGMFHLINALFHAVNSCLVVCFILEFCHFYQKQDQSNSEDTPWIFIISAFASGLFFAFHPLHVESVAWVSELRDLQSTFFSLITLLFFIRYIQSPRLITYLSAFFFFTAALLSKPMVVTLPAIMLGLFFLKNILTASSSNSAHYSKLSALKVSRKRWGDHFLHLAPFFICSLLIIYVEIYAQGVIQEITHFSSTISSSGKAIFYSIVFYLAKFLLPLKLAPYYEDFSILNHKDFISAFALLAFIFCGWLQLVHLRKLIISGLIFFIITISPVLKLIPFGRGAVFNDRYFYFPSIGLFFSFFVILAEIILCLKKRNKKKLMIGVISVFGCHLVLLTFLSYQRILVWENNETLWKDAEAQYPTMSVAKNNLAAFYVEQNRFPEAIEYLKKAILIFPNDPSNYINLAVYYNRIGKLDEAIEIGEKLMKLHLANETAMDNLGIWYIKKGRIEDAKNLFFNVIQNYPRFAESYVNLSTVEFAQKHYKESLFHINKALELNPKEGEYYWIKSQTLSLMKCWHQAELSSQKAIEFQFPISSSFLENLKNHKTNNECPY